MKKFIFLVISIFMFAKTPMASTLDDGGMVGGHGGDTDAISFTQFGNFISTTLNSDPAFLASFPEIEKNKFKKAVEQTKVEMVDEPSLTLRGRSVTAINYPKYKKIRISRPQWKEISSDKLLRATLALHEYLGIMGAEVDQYSISIRFHSYFNTEKTYAKAFNDLFMYKTFYPQITCMADELSRYDEIPIGLKIKGKDKNFYYSMDFSMSPSPYLKGRSPESIKKFMPINFTEEIETTGNNKMVFSIYQNQVTSFDRYDYQATLVIDGAFTSVKNINLESLEKQYFEMIHFVSDQKIIKLKCSIDHPNITDISEYAFIKSRNAANDLHQECQSILFRPIPIFTYLE